MNSISIRHKFIIKTAVAKHRFVQDMIRRYGEEVISPDFGLVNRYYEMAGLKSVDTMSAEYEDFITSLPSLWEDAKKIMESEIESRSSDTTLDELISLGLKKEDLINKQVRSWLKDRYVKNKEKEVHPINETLPTIKEYVLLKDSILTKIKVDNGLRKELEDRGFTEDRVKNPLSLSSDEMIQILGQYKYGGKTAIRTVGVEIRDSERVGKVGEWNIWLPQTQETSAKIAGYDDVTKEPKTDWCTNRTRGSNLFYHYISRGKIISFLFYIIRDNPEENNDWLSVGFIGRKEDGVASIKPVFDGKHGGITVNGNNKGLFESDFKKILGNLWPDIKNKIESKILELDGKNPATLELEKYAKDISLFKKEFWNKSEEERIDFVDIILDLNASDDVRSLCLKHLAEKKPLRFLEYSDESLAKPYLDIAAKKIVEIDPTTILRYCDKDWAKPYLDDAAKRASDNNSEIFIEYCDKDWAKPYLDTVAKNMAENKPEVFLYSYQDASYANEICLRPYLDIAANNIAEKNPLKFFKNYSYYWWAKPYLHIAAKDIAKKEPYLLVNYLNEEWIKPYIDIIASYLLEKSPYTLLEYSDAEWARPYVDIVIKNSDEKELLKMIYRYKDSEQKHYLDVALKSLAEKNPQELLDKKGYDWVEPYIDLAANSAINKSPYEFFKNNLRREWATPYLMSALQKFNEKELQDILLNFEYDPYFHFGGFHKHVQDLLKSKISSDKFYNMRLIKLSKVLSSIGLIKESSSIIRLASGGVEFLSDEMSAELARIAQETYDEWEQDEKGWSDSFNEIGVGGICHIIAERITSYINAAGGYGSDFMSCSVSDPFVQHVYVVAWKGYKNEDLDPEEELEDDEDSLLYDIYSIDIPYWTYEEGGGFTWKKIPDIKFGARDVEISLIESGATRDRLDEITNSY